MAEVTNAPGTQPLTPGKAGLGVTQRTDPWWAEWLGVAVGLALLFGYAGAAAFLGKGQWGPYLSPFYSPEFLHLDRLHIHAPSFIPVALIPLVVIIGFRATCYYYRKSYYRAFFADPAGCAVGESRANYEGETKFPFIIQNAHRYFMVLATFFLLFLWYDAIVALIPALAGKSAEFGVVNIKFGSILMIVNCCLLSGYTLGCHSLRHLVGGKNDCMSCAPAQLAGWKSASKFNAKHMEWAWASLISVCLTDLYIRLSGMGLLHLESWIGGLH
jgi:hypothetical protein